MTKSKSAKAGPKKTGTKALGEGTGPAGGYLVPKGNTVVKKPKKKKS